MTNEAEKKEVQALLEAVSRSSKRRRSRNLLLLKIGAGYAAMAIFTTGALIFSSINLGDINTTAREITLADLPAVSAMMRLRTALAAQERFAGEFAILKDPSFVELFRQREKEFLANLRVLRQAGSLQEHRELEGLYASYQTATQRLFSDGRGASGEQQATAANLFKALNDLNLKRQRKLHDVIERADRQRKSTIKWTAAISCAGFLLAVCIAPLLTNRIFAATRRLQVATQSALAGEYRYSPEAAAYEEIGDLAENVAALAGKLSELERLNFAAAPIRGNPVAERILKEQSQQREQQCFCDVRIDELSFIVAQHGYLKATQLICLTAYLLQAAAREQGGGGYAGYVGGNGFLMILPPDKVQPVCEDVIRGFDAEVQTLFSPRERNEERAGADRCAPATIGISALIRGAGESLSVTEFAGALDLLREQTAGKGAGSRWEIAGAPVVPHAPCGLRDETDSTTGALEEI